MCPGHAILSIDSTDEYDRVTRHAFFFPENTDQHSLSSVDSNYEYDPDMLSSIDSSI